MSERDPLSHSPEVTPADTFHHAMQAVENHNKHYIAYIIKQCAAESGTTLSVEEETRFMQIAHGSILRDVGVELIEHSASPAIGATTLAATLVNSERFAMFLHNVPSRPFPVEIHDSVADIMNEAFDRLQVLYTTESPLAYVAVQQIISLESGLTDIGMSYSRHLAEIKLLKQADIRGIVPEYLTARSLNLLPGLNGSEYAPSNWHEDGDSFLLHSQWNAVTHFLRTLVGKAHTRPFLKEILSVTKCYLQQSEEAWSSVDRFRQGTDEKAFVLVFEAVNKDLREIESSVNT